MTKVQASTLKAGDVVMPPEREVRLWMRRTITERGLSESALHLTVTKIEEGAPDKKGRWILVTADYSAEFYGDRKPWPITFRARPDTPWPLISSEKVAA